VLLALPRDGAAVEKIDPGADRASRNAIGRPVRVGKAEETVGKRSVRLWTVLERERGNTLEVPEDAFGCSPVIGTRVGEVTCEHLGGERNFGNSPFT
jgi:hypothetical protein